MTNTKNKAFSLIELSIVILIIGILIAGVTQGSRLVNQFKIQTARKLTQSSPVASIKDLAVWYETSMEDAVTIDSSSNVTQWNDRNPQSPNKINASTTTTALPVYVEGKINGLPVLQFSGTNKNIVVDPSGNGLNFLAGTNYTIFVVEQRVVGGDINGNAFFFLRGTGGGNSTNLQYGYNNDGFISNDWGLDWNIPVTLTAPLTTRIHTLQFNTLVGKTYWMKSTSAPYTATNAGFIGNPLVSYAGAKIGGDGSLDGSMAEMIIFTRALKTTERTDVENYLGKKYNIKM